MAKGPNRETFLDDVEGHLRECVRNKLSLVCWRGKYPRTLGENTYEYETVIVGMSDSDDSKIPPAMPILKVWLEGPFGDANIEYSIGADDDVSAYTPFGGGWDPLEEVKELSQRLALL